MLYLIFPMETNNERYRLDKLIYFGKFIKLMFTENSYNMIGRV